MEDYISKLIDQESIYICICCHEIYEENPGFCADYNGTPHSQFIDMVKFRAGQIRSYSPYRSILRFDVGQINNLDYVTGMGNVSLERTLLDNGFERLGRVDNSRERRRETMEEVEASWKRVKQEALALASKLNAQGERYIVFSNSYMRGALSYTFMGKG